VILALLLCSMQGTVRLLRLIPVVVGTGWRATHDENLPQKPIPCAGCAKGLYTRCNNDIDNSMRCTCICTLTIKLNRHELVDFANPTQVAFAEVIPKLYCIS